MLVLLCLPCTVKQNIKQAFDIPVSQIERSEKPEKAGICQTVTIDASRKAFDLNPQKVMPGDVVTSLHHTALLFHTPPTKNLWDKQLFTSIPIYLLYDEFLI